MKYALDAWKINALSCNCMKRFYSPLHPTNWPPSLNVKPKLNATRQWCSAAHVWCSAYLLKFAWLEEKPQGNDFTLLKWKEKCKLGLANEQMSVYACRSLSNVHYKENKWLELARSQRGFSWYEQVIICIENKRERERDTTWGEPYDMGHISPVTPCGDLCMIHPLPHTVNFWE